MSPCVRVRRRRAWVPIAFGLGLTALAGPAVSQQDAAELRGSWEAQGYVLSGGATHAVRGQIHFTQTDWLVLFFVMDGAEPARGSAEGGRYTLQGDLLTFEHLHHLSVGRELAGLAASPLRMETSAEGAKEPTRIELDADSLTLLFPSGNRMTFVRSSAP
ncbi:MAG: hypothetical protein OEU54_03135 [Gemmatimonadota bacterium]|nr:hypothetical protein [Gemmatimonadota bacterium]